MDRDNLKAEWKKLALGLISLSYFAFFPGDFALCMGWVINAEGANGVGLQTLLTEQMGVAWLAKLVGIVFVFMALWRTWKTREASGSLLALWISVYFLIYNRIWIHHFSLFYLGIALVLMDGKKRLWNGALLLIPLALATLPNAVASSDLLSQILHSIASLWLFGVCFRELRDDQRTVS